MLLICLFVFIFLKFISMKPVTMKAYFLLFVIILGVLSIISLTGVLIRRAENNRYSKWMPSEFIDVLKHNPQLLVLEPALLTNALGQNKTSNEVNQEMADLNWRFNLSQVLPWDKKSLTVGVLASNWNDNKWHRLGCFESILNVTGPLGQFNGTNLTVITHQFYKCTNYWLAHIGKYNLYLHIVVLHQVKNFLWVGPIVEHVLLNFSHFSHYVNEQIYDPFGVTSINDISYPDDIPHLLSQLPTAQYIHCPSERGATWFAKYNISMDQLRAEEEKVRQAVRAIKALMRYLKMELWLASANLLGWYRTCSVVLGASDVDLNTWAKYAQADGVDMTKLLQNTVSQFKLKVYLRFGTSNQNLEYFIKTVPPTIKLDLFFIYQNETHYLMPNHWTYGHVAGPQWSYDYYYKYQLCSVDYLGYKMLAPCNPEESVLAEYGPDWNKPANENWLWYQSPRNIEPWKPWTNTENDQFEYFY